MLLSLAAPAQQQFTPAEEAVIARNAALAQLRRSNPDIVRKALDELAALRARKRRDFRDPDPPGGADLPFDPARNPDLMVLKSGSPEAAHDLFQLIKQAGTKQR